MRYVRFAGRPLVNGRIHPYVPSIPDVNFSSGKDAAATLLKCREIPEAALCFCDTLSIGLEMGLLDHGISIPGTMALAGFSGTLEMAITKIPITGIFQNAAILGKTSAEFLLKRMINPKVRLIPETKILKTKLVTRQSSLKEKPLALRNNWPRE